MAEYNFSPRQIAEMAMGVEEAGEEFYTKLASVLDDQKLKDIFLILSKAELQHRDMFKNIAGSFSGEEDSEYSIDLPTLMKRYIDKLKEVAFNIKSFSSKPDNVQEALNIAIYTEEEAIRIYTEMYNSFVDKFHDILTKIINEEKKHLGILTDIQAKTHL